MSEPVVRLTVAQAVVRFLAQQYTERDGERQRLFAGCFGIFGHGNVAGVGQALLQAEIDEPQAPGEALRYVLGRNVHVETDPFVDAPSSESWWDVPVSAVATVQSTRDAHAHYAHEKSPQRSYLRPTQP